MTDRELVDALRSTTSRSKRKLLDAAADRIESTIRVRTTIDDETIYGFPIRDLVVAATVMRRNGIEPEDLRKLCHNLDFAFNAAWEELEKTIERAMAERAKAYLVTANHFAAERKMIMDEVKYYPARMNHPNLCRPLTNADRIRQMSDEELAMCLYEIGYDRGWGAPEGTLEWLQRPAEVTK